VFCHGKRQSELLGITALGVLKAQFIDSLSSVLLIKYTFSLPTESLQKISVSSQAERSIARKSASVWKLLLSNAFKSQLPALTGNPSRYSVFLVLAETSIPAQQRSGS